MVRVLSATRPSHLVFAFDGKTDNLTRKKIFPQYKEGRHIDRKTGEPKDRSDLFAQVKKCKDILDAWGLRWYEGIADEADDIIATLHRLARKAGHDVRIISVDKDLYQLVDEHTTCSDFMGQDVVTSKEVELKFGIPPKLVGPYLIMCGDSSDKVPGIKGVGAVMAKKLIAEHGSWEAIKAAIPEMPAGLKTKFENSDISLMERLINLNKFVKLVKTSSGKSKCLFNNCLHQNTPLKKIADIVEECGFYSLMQ